MPINQSSSSGSKHSAWRELRELLPAWALALALSAVLVAAGQRWPQPLTPDGRWLVLLLLGPPLLMGLVLTVRWLSAASPGDRGRGESGD